MGRRSTLRRIARSLCVGALVAGCGASIPPLRASGASTVILLSLDGVRHDYLDRGGLPALERMAREGARAEALVPVFPASTFPNHVSLATGATPQRHGILANHFRDRVRGEFDYSNDASWIDAEPLWVTAERQGVTSAVFFWVGSETDWKGRGASHRRAPFSSRIPERDKVDQILDWMDLPLDRRPRLVLSWWHGADRPGHRFGPDAAETMKALRGQDQQLARLLAGLDARGAWATTTLLVVSDHGMARVDRILDPTAHLAEHGIGARAISGGGFAHVFLDDPSQRGAALKALDGVEAVRAHASDALPEILAYARPTRLGDLLLLTDPPFRFASGGSASRVARLLVREAGAHGYEPGRHPEMAGILLALGRGVDPGVALGRVRVLDVAPSVTRLLDIDPPLHAEGTAIPELGREPRLLD